MEVGGKPTIRLSGANVQIPNGEGSTNTTNGAGNLIIGYDENPQTQTGSHNLIGGPGSSAAKTSQPKPNTKQSRNSGEGARPGSGRDAGGWWRSPRA